MAAAGGASRQISGVNDLEKAAADAKEAATTHQAEMDRLRESERCLLQQEAQITAAWREVLDKRASDEKRRDEENRKWASEIESINAEHDAELERVEKKRQAALEKVTAGQEAASKAKELANEQYSEEIVRKNDKLRIVMTRRKALTTELTQAEKTAEMAQQQLKQVLRAKINLASEREMKAAAHLRKQVKAKKTLEDELAALSGSGPILEVQELHTDETEIRKGSNVQIRAIKEEAEDEEEEQEREQEQEKEEEKEEEEEPELEEEEEARLGKRKRHGKGKASSRKQTHAASHERDSAKSQGDASVPGTGAQNDGGAAAGAPSVSTDVVTRRQESWCHKHGCQGFPRFGIAGSKKAEFCHRHMKEGMVNVTKWDCGHPSCVKWPHFGMAGSKKVEFCSDHAKEGMVNVTKNKCGHPGCNNVPHFGMAGSKKIEFCSSHASEDMVNLSRRKCVHRRCNKFLLFCVAGTSRRELCKKHAKRAMVKVDAARK